MDRIISLLAALVALIALAASVIVSTNADITQRSLGEQIAALKADLALAGQAESIAQPAPATDALESLASRVGALEAATALQPMSVTSALEAASEEGEVPVAIASDQPADGIQAVIPSALPSQGAPAGAIADNAKDADCIPLGTRFMVKANDAIPICRTDVVVRVSSVSAGSVILQDAGEIAAGAASPLAVSGCQAMVMSADDSGYAELWVTCR